MIIFAGISALSFIIFNQSAFAAQGDICPTATEQLTCTPDYVCGGQCRPSLPSYPSGGQLNQYNLNCTDCAWQCNTAVYPCSNCSLPSSTQGSPCADAPGCPTNGIFTNQCSAVGCPASLPNNCSGVCRANAPPGSVAGCAPGQTYDVCNGCQGKSFVILNPDAVQSGFIEVTGNVKSAGDLYLVDGKAIRVDGSGDTTLNIGNWGGGGLNLNVLGDLKIGPDGGEGRISDISELVGFNDLFIKASAGENQTIYYGALEHKFYTNNQLRLTIDSDGNISVAGNILSGSIQGNFLSSGGQECVNDQILKRVNGAWVCSDVSAAQFSEIDPIFTTWKDTAPVLENLAINGQLGVGAGGAIDGYYAGIDNLGNMSLAGNFNVWGSLRLRGDSSQLILANITGALPAGENKGALIYDANTGVDAVKFWDGDSWELLAGGAIYTAGDYITIAPDNKISATHSNGCFGPVFQQMSGASSSGDAGGYSGANSFCLAGEHVCTTAEMLNSINCGIDLSSINSEPSGVWISNGAPSLPQPTNDCLGWTSNNTSWRGIHYVYTPQGGAFYAKKCDESLKFACCQ